ncbi:MAG: STAS domain-containing protein [Nocardioides sp.]
MWAKAGELHLSGQVDGRHTPGIREALYRLLEGDAPVVVDLSAVSSIDLPALRLLAAASRQSGRAGQRLTLRGCSPSVRRLLRLSRMAHCVALERAAAPV